MPPIIWAVVILAGVLYTAYRLACRIRRWKVSITVEAE